MTTPCKVLVVENPKDRRNSMVVALKRLGQEVTAASSAEEAMVRYSKGAFDVLLVDQVLPGKSGTGFVNLIRLLDEKVGIILTTTGDPTALDADAEGLSIWSILQKPVSDELLMEKVEEACQFAHLSPEKEREFCEALQTHATKFRHIRSDLRNESSILPPMEMQEEMERYEREREKIA